MGNTGMFNRSGEVVWQENIGLNELVTKINGRFFVLREGEDGAIRLFLLDGFASEMIAAWPNWEAAKTEAGGIAANRVRGLGCVEVEK